MDQVYDIVIVGGGPAGLSAGLNSTIRGCRTLVLDAGASMLARAELVDNYLGMPRLTGEAMMAAFHAHAAEVGAIIEKGRATSILPMGNQWMVSYGNTVATAYAVIIAVGARREKAIDGEEAYLGRGLSYCATCDGMLYRGKKVLVYGLAHDAPEEANYLAQIGVEVVYASPGERPEDLQKDIQWLGATLQRVEGEDTVKQALFVEQDLPPMHVDGVFLLREVLAPTSLVHGVQVEEGHIAVDRVGKTNIAGLYACGDCAGAPLQVAKAVGEGLVAGQEAAKYVLGLKA